MTRTTRPRSARRTTVGALLLALAALALTACTGSNSSPGSEIERGVSLQQVKDKGVLTIGTEGTYPPFTFHAQGSGDLVGYDVDVARAVAAKLGVKAEFKETQFDAMFAGLQAGRFDMVANQVSITPERKKTYEFSTPYTVSPGVIVVRKDDDSIRSFTDLKDKTVAQSLTSSYYQLAQSSGARIQDVEGWAQAITLLKQGRVDATINDKLTFLDHVKSQHDSSIKIAATTRDEAHNAFAFRPGSTTLVGAVDEALKELDRDGTLATISKKYFGQDVSH
ncbi:MAG: amino acid ABC transporter substrate-binding protein [Marmoricola sp.]